MARVSTEVLAAIAQERGVPLEQVAAEFGEPVGAPPPVMVEPAPAPEPAPVAEPVALPPAADLAPPPVAEPAPVPVEPPPDPTEGATDELERLTQQQADAAMQVGEAEAQAAQREVERRDEWDREAAEIAKKHDTREAAADEMQRTAMERFRKLNAEIENTEIRDDRTSGQRVWGAIGLALAGWSEGLSGGTNNAVAQVAGLINEGVDRRIAIQKSNLENKRKSSDAAQTEYGIARQYLGDTREATEYARAAAKERFANSMAREAAQLTSQTARARATQVATQFKVEAQKEKLDVLKKALGGKMSAMEAAMLVKLGVLSPAEAKAQMGVAGGAPGAAPADSVPGALTKTQQGAVNVATHQNEVPGLTWLVDPSKVSKEDREAAQKIKSGSDRAVKTVQKARAAYEIAIDPKRSDEERLSALNRYRTLTNVQLPGYVSQATGSGTPQESEAQRLLASLPPAPVVNDVAGARALLQRMNNWANDTTMDPRAFDYFAEDFGDIVDSGLEAYKARRGTATPPPSSSGKPKAKQGGKAKPAVATSPEDFD